MTQLPMPSMHTNRTTVMETLLIILMVILMSPFFVTFNIGPLNIKQLFLLVTLGFIGIQAALILINRTPTLDALDPVSLAFHGIIIVMIGGSFLISRDPSGTLIQTASYVSNFLLVMILASRYESTQVMRIVVKAVIVLIILSYAVFPLPIFWQVIDGRTCFMGVFSHKNTLAEFGVLSCILLQYGLPTYPRKNLWLALAGGLILLSRSTTGLVTLGVAVLVVLLRNALRGSRFQKLTGLGFLFSAGIATTAIFFGLVQYLVVEVFHKDLTLTGRTKIWGVILKDLADRDFMGYGYGAVWSGNLDYARWVSEQMQFNFLLTEAHNGYLELVLSVGPHMLLVFTAFLLYLLFRKKDDLNTAFLVFFIILNVSESRVIQDSNFLTAFFNYLSLRAFVYKAPWNQIPIEDPEVLAWKV